MSPEINVKEFTSIEDSLECYILYRVINYPDEQNIICRRVKPEWFSNLDLKCIFERIYDMYNKNYKIHFFSIKANVQNNLELEKFVISNLSVDSAKDSFKAELTREHIDLLEKEYQNRETEALLMQSLDALQNYNSNCIDLLTDISDKIAQLSNITESTVTTLAESIIEHDKVVKEIITSDERKYLGIETGFTLLDSAMSGLCNSKLIVVAGLTSVLLSYHLPSFVYD